jgi:hypothetical protein
MSIDVLSWVLKHSDETLGRRLVLLALADCAHDDGRGAWPSVQTVADKARLSRRQAQRCLRDLEENGSIERDGSGRHGTACWTVVMGRKDVAPTDCQGATNRTPDGSELVQNVARTVITTEPSLNPLPPNEIETVWKHWRKTMAPAASFSDDRERTIRKALKIATVAECVRAINGCATSDFHMARGQYADQAKQTHLSLILRNRENIERFMELASDDDKSSAINGKIRRAKMSVLTAFELPGSAMAQTEGRRAEIFLNSQDIAIVRDGPDARPTFTQPGGSE